FLFVSSRRRHTRFSRDWSSDVCSSDLAVQADDGIAPPLLAALHGFEQVGVRLVGQREVEGKRGVEIGQRLERQRDAVVAFGGQTQEVFAGHVSLVVGGAKQKVGQTGRRSRRQ